VHQHGRQRRPPLVIIVGGGGGFVLTRSRLRLLRRCRTAATVRPRTQDRPQTHRRIRPIALPRGNAPTHDGLSLVLAQQQAIRRWRAPRHPEYVTLAKRTRTFYDRKWEGEGKPSVDSIAAARFLYDGRSKIFKSYISNFTNFQIFSTYLNFKLSYFQISRDALIHPGSYSNFSAQI